LVDRVPAHSQVVLAVRAESELPPPLFAAGSYERVLAADDLRLTDAEAGAILRANGFDVNDADATSLNARSDGWATGLYLAGLSLRDAGAPGDHARLGAKRHVVDYFRLEVLDRLAVGDRELLLEISCVDRICGELCDAISGRSNSAARLASLARENVFL